MQTHANTSEALYPSLMLFVMLVLALKRNKANESLEMNVDFKPNLNIT